MRRSPLRPSTLSILSFGVLGLAAASTAANLQQVTASPNPAQVGQSVAVTVKTGSGPCAYLVSFGNGQSTGVVGNGTGTKTYSTQYAQPGSFTITVQGQKKGNKPKCGGTKTTTVAVQSRGGPRGGASPLGKASKGAVNTLGAGGSKPMPNLKLGCDDLPCVTGVETEPHGTYADLKVFTSQAASVQVYASTKPLSPNALGKPPHSAMNFGYEHATTLRLTNLEAGTLYHYVAKSVDPNGVAMWKKGTFKTLRRRVTLSIEKMVVHDDGDGGTTGKGDFWIFLFHGNKKEKVEVKVGTGGTYAPLVPGLHSLTVMDASTDFPVKARVVETDTFFAGSQDDVTKMVSLDETGIGEETEQDVEMRLKGEFDVTLTVRVKVHYVP